MPKERIPCKCLSIIMINSIIKANKKYYPQTLLEEFKYLQENIKKNWKLSWRRNRKKWIR